MTKDQTLTATSPLDRPITSGHGSALSPGQRGAQDRRFSAQRRISAAQRAFARALAAQDERERMHALIDAAGIVGDLHAPSAQEAALLLDRAAQRGLSADASAKIATLLKQARNECSAPRDRLLRAAALIRVAMGLTPDPLSRSYDFAAPEHFDPASSDDYEISDAARAAMLLRAEDYLVDTHGAKGPLMLLRAGDAYTALLNLESQTLKLGDRRDVA